MPVPDRPSRGAILKAHTKKTALAADADRIQMGILPIVRKAIEGMNGRIGGESQPGSGSRFWFELEAE